MHVGKWISHTGALWEYWDFLFDISLLTGFFSSGTSTKSHQNIHITADTLDFVHDRLLHDSTQDVSIRQLYLL